MQAYGRKKSPTHVDGHQDCGTCHPVQKNKKKRARRESKRQVNEGALNVRDYFDADHDPWMVAPDA